MVKKIKIISIAAFVVICVLIVKKVFDSNIQTIEDFQKLMQGCRTG